MIRPPDLRIIDGGKSEGIKFGHLRVNCGSSTSGSSFTPEVRIVEEDTWQILSADPTIREVHEHPIRLMTGLIDQRPLKVGQIAVKGKQWHAVIYNFDMEPICQQDTVSTALQHIADKAAETNTRTMAIPLLGHAHGCLVLRDSLELIVKLLLRSPPATLNRVWLIVSDEHLTETHERLLKAARFCPPA